MWPAAEVRATQMSPANASSAKVSPANMAAAKMTATADVTASAKMAAATAMTSAAARPGRIRGARKDDHQESDENSQFRHGTLGSHRRRVA